MEVEDFRLPQDSPNRKVSLERMKNRAQVALQEKPVIRPGYVFPVVDQEIIFDIEDDPTCGVVYLFGYVIL